MSIVAGPSRQSLRLKGAAFLAVGGRRSKEAGRFPVESGPLFEIEGKLEKTVHPCAFRKVAFGSLDFRQNRPIERKGLRDFGRCPHSYKYSYRKSRSEEHTSE